MGTPEQFWCLRKHRCIHFSISKVLGSESVSRGERELFVQPLAGRTLFYENWTGEHGFLVD